MEIGRTKWINTNATHGDSIQKDVELDTSHSFLYFITKRKIQDIVSSQLQVIATIDLRINGFRNIDSGAEKMSDVVSSVVGSPIISSVGIASKMLSSTSSTLVFVDNYLITIDRTSRGNPFHFTAYDIRTLKLLELYKDYQSWDRSVFHFIDGKTLEFGAPNAMGIAGNPNKKIIKYLVAKNLIKEMSV
jgi:hypothetical protein